MAETPNRGWPLPDQATAPPDVAGWMATSLGAVDLDWTILDAAILAVNNRLQYGPIADVPTTLAPGSFYFAW
jgi:hypothetical protein